MEHAAAATGGAMITGFQAIVAFVAWVVVVLGHGIWRSIASPEPDPIRPAGPTGL